MNEKTLANTICDRCPFCLEKTTKVFCVYVTIIPFIKFGSVYGKEGWSRFELQ